MNDFVKLGMFRASGLSLLLLSAAFGCAGSDVPPTTDDLENDLRVAYGRGSQSAAGGSASTNAGAGGAAAGSAGTGNNVDNGGSAGDGGADSNGGSSSTEAGSGGDGEAGSGESGAGGGTGGDCEEGFAVLEANCTGASCHNGSPGLTPFASDEGDAADFIGMKSPSYPGCGNIFDPEDPPGSVVIQKMRGDSACGPQMPLGAAPLSEADITCVEQWIGSL